MKKLTLSGLTVAAVILVTAVVIGGIILNSLSYRQALNELAQGNLARAREKLESVEAGYRDRDELIDCIDYMLDYDPRDPASVYRCYRGVSSISSSLGSSALDAGVSEMCADMGSLYSSLGCGNGLG